MKPNGKNIYILTLLCQCPMVEYEQGRCTKNFHWEIKRMRSSQQEHLVHRVIKYCWAGPKLLVKSLVLLSGLTLIALCLVVPGFAHWENTSLLNLFWGHSRSLRPNSYHSCLPSGAGLKPKVCLRHQTTTVVFQTCGFWAMWVPGNWFGFGYIFFQSVF